MTGSSHRQLPTNDGVAGIPRQMHSWRSGTPLTTSFSLRTSWWLYWTFFRSQNLLSFSSLLGVRLDNNLMALQPSSVPSLFSLTHAFSHKKSLMHLIPYSHLLLEGRRLTQSMILRCLWVFLMVAKRGPELLPSHSLPQLKKKKRQKKKGYTHCIQSF